MQVFILLLLWDWRDCCLCPECLFISLRMRMEVCVCVCVCVYVCFSWVLHWPFKHSYLPWSHEERPLFSLQSVWYLSYSIWSAYIEYIEGINWWSGSQQRAYYYGRHGVHNRFFYTHNICNDKWTCISIVLPVKWPLKGYTHGGGCYAQLIRSNFGFSILLKDTSTCKPVGTGNRTSDLPIN